MQFKYRKIKGSIIRFFSPGWGWCYRCGTTWNACKSHSTKITAGEGMFPLCEDCWQELTPETRLPFYEMLFMSWKSHYADDNGRAWSETWQLIKSAVNGGG